jgi:hypothetical protein
MRGKYKSGPENPRIHVCAYVYFLYVRAYLFIQYIHVCIYLRIFYEESILTVMCAYVRAMRYYKILLFTILSNLRYSWPEYLRELLIEIKCDNSIIYEHIGQILLFVFFFPRKIKNNCELKLSLNYNNFQQI